MSGLRRRRGLRTQLNWALETFDVVTAEERATAVRSSRTRICLGYPRYRPPASIREGASEASDDSRDTGDSARN